MESYEKFLDNFDSPIMITAADGKILFCNKAAGKLFIEEKKKIIVERIIPLTGAYLVYLSDPPNFEPADLNIQNIIFHQFNAPLAAIKWTTESLLELMDESKTKLNDIYNSDGALISLVNDLLNLNRISAGKKLIPKFASTKAEELLAKVISLLKPLADRNNQKINLKIRGSAYPLRADSDLLSRALSNLLENAVNYGPKDSEIGVSCDFKDESCVIGIHNFGPAIPAEEQKSLFTRFFRTETAKKLKPQGSGLGLFIAKSIVEANGGKIWCESDDKKGTTFFIEIPKSG
jgi:signal transduction histidine kinase